ncbi:MULTISPECIES: PolC-type DNA polymerase III [unclassified Granulicatella]|uniref:PolC-type DNA polymerase III n=1 Tax=unclassified Granulicatella TaxID=2630493 RepID=UPI001074980B|nr:MULTISPECIES: PolC-type DNA polymerase III [unclassified Granulicatella]MBF0780346.1 PolC-type DNA polymerase III [Granulicatella sp. 19428wC4_WM01]TFU95525.1 PolC-type DNA polymerase III [Granulicatella sp. WM01]
MADKVQLFSILLEQIGLKNHHVCKDYDGQVRLEKVVVSTKENRWQFYLTQDLLMPYTHFELIKTAIQETFVTIAQTVTVIQAKSAPLSIEMIREYWSYVIECVVGDNQGLKHVLVNQDVQLVDNQRLRLSVDSEYTHDYVKEKCLTGIKQVFMGLGFPQFTIELVLDKEMAQQKQEAFIKRQQEELNQLAHQAQIQMEQQAVKEQVELKEEVTLEGNVILGRQINPDEPVVQMGDLVDEQRSVLIRGYIFASESKVTKNGRNVYTIKFTDYSGSFAIKLFARNEKDAKIYDAYLKKGNWIKVRGDLQEDQFLRDIVMVPRDINLVDVRPRIDTAVSEHKRVELHVHTTMSQMDATNNIADYVAQAAKWGHKAIAITDHGGVQGFPDAHWAGVKHDVKILYGVEAYVVDDGVPVAYNLQHVLLSDATYVVFDVETTGLSAVYDTIIELAAVKMYKGNVIDTFEAFINPGHPLSSTTISLTGITDEMVRTQGRLEKDVLEDFQKFCEGAILVAHNATFDMGFLNTSYRKLNMPEANNPVIDTLELSRALHPELKSHRLNVLAKKYGVSLEQHHRAVYDSETTGHLCYIFLKEAQENYNILYHDELNKDIGANDAYKRSRPFHVTILAKNEKGLKDLFKIVSKSNVEYFYRVPRVPRSVLVAHREHLLLGSACSEGEVFEAMMQKGYDEALKKAEFYDYLEVMPKEVYAPLINQELVHSEKELEEIIKNIIKIGKTLNKLVVATGNVHYLNKEDYIYREILISTMKANVNREMHFPKVHFRTTDEMIRCFDFLEKEDIDDIVWRNPQKIADSIEKISPVKKDLYTPKIEGAEEDITNLSYNEAKRLYGNPLPDIVEKRLEKELKSIIGNGFSVIYLISQKLVHKSVADGYLVGSRGSVGSSFVATMTGITEVNPLAPHYRCPNCQYSEFFEEGEYGSGYDLPEKECPNCQHILDKDGQDIPFETFLGFYGDKVPDIDLNFSGDYQAKAHAYTKELFGEDYVYRAGTIGTVAEKTAYGYVRAYERDKNLQYKSAEVDRLTLGATGVKRTTGQHPGGIIVIPDYMDVYDFTPIQYPADAQDAEWRTTHFDFHSIHDNVLKLDILGHDDPTMIRMLQDLSGRDPRTIPPTDPDVMKIFQGTEVLGVTPEQIDSKMGTLGIPEFGTKFVRGMLEATKPSTFAELLQISGLSHGTDVYLGNAEELIRKGIAPLSKVIGCRDDIMVYLIHAGLEDGIAFKIMESVRKGKGIPEEWQEIMRENNVPEWYIDSCLKIKYMFPKAHAAAYVLMALRVAYYKVHEPLLYYCAYFSVRANDFDLVSMVQGKEMVKTRMKEINDKGLDATVKEKSLLTVLEIANEMLERGFTFKMVDIKKSDASKFIIEGNSLLAPFRAVPSLGGSVAQQIVQAREEGEFLSQEDLAKRGKLSKTLMDYFVENGVLSDLPESNQLSLFDF